MKICRKCKSPKPPEDFQIDRRLKSGRTSMCRPCAANEANRWHRENRDHHNKKMGEWRKQDKIKNPGVYLWRIAKRRASETGRKFEITRFDIHVPNVCPILGTKLEFTPGEYSPNAPSLDAIRPELGYVPGNIAVISHRANSIKQNASPEELRAVADWLEKRLQSEASSPAQLTLF